MLYGGDKADSVEQRKEREVAENWAELQLSARLKGSNVKLESRISHPAKSNQKEGFANDSEKGIYI
jgi:hypothetical protein